MDNIATCPDCKSQDVQEKTNDQLVVTSKRNWKGCWLVFLSGFFLVIAMVAAGGESIHNRDTLMGLACLILLVTPIVSFFVLSKVNIKSEDISHKYYVCRACGREFH
jgi:transposase-like protein